MTAHLSFCWVLEILKGDLKFHVYNLPTLFSSVLQLLVFTVSMFHSGTWSVKKHYKYDSVKSMNPTDLSRTLTAIQGAQQCWNPAVQWVFFVPDLQWFCKQFKMAARLSRREQRQAFCTTITLAFYSCIALSLYIFT